MRKMTYTQAATCGENLKVRVTPEQSEKMQKAWFAAGKTWNDDDNRVSVTNKPSLFLSKKLTASTAKDYFEADARKEIELIDDPQPDFASQQEIWQWIIEGNKINDDTSVFGFKNGVMWNFTSNQKATHYSFCDVIYWKKHTPPRLIRVNGIEVPAPLESLEGLSVVYIAAPSSKRKYIEVLIEFINHYQDTLELSYATKEDAIKRAEAMRLFEVVE